MLRSRFDFDRLTRALPARRRSRPATLVTIATAGAAAGAGALLAFAFDPTLGRRRRAEAGARAAGAARRLTRRSGRRVKYVQGVLEGTPGRVRSGLMPGGDVDDRTLTDKVMSEVFGEAGFPKGTVDVNAEHGVVVLRGEVGTPEVLDSIETRVRAVHGVRDVRNLMHLPKTPAAAAAGPRRRSPRTDP